MKFLFRSIKVLAVLILILLVVSLFLPSTSVVSREVEINAPPQKVFGYINSFRQFNRWSPWYGLDPDAKYAYEGPETGVGGIMRWSSEDPSVGSGTQEIIAVVPDKSVQTRLEFAGQGDAIAIWSLQPAGEGTHVTWSFETEWGFNPIGRYMGLMMDKWVGEFYEKGLNNLKQLIE